MQASNRPLSLIIAGSLAGCAQADAPGCLPLDDGTATVANRGDGVWAERGMTGTLVELWRAGGVTDGEELAFPLSIAAGPGGRVAVPDWMLAEVAVIASDGRWLGTRTRPGSGPGEVRQPVAAAWTADGDLAVFDIVGQRIVVLGDDGLPVREDLAVASSVTGPILADGSFRGAGLLPDGTVLLLPDMRPLPAGSLNGQGSMVVLRLAPGGARPDTLVSVALPVVEPPSAGRLPARGWPQAVAAVGPDGTHAVGSDDGSYRILLYGADRLPLRLVCRAAPPLPLDARERGESTSPTDDATAALLQEVASALAAAPPPPAMATFGRLVVGRAGALWVQRERPAAASVGGAGMESIQGVAGARWDVFDQGGVFQGTVRAPQRARIQAVAGDTVWALEFGMLDEPYVVAYRLAVR